MGNDWFHEYFINEVKAIGRKPTSNMQYEVVDSLPSSGNERTIYFVKNDSGSSNNHYDEYVWISSSSTFEKIGSSQIDGSTTQPNWNQNDATQPDYVKNRPFYTGDPVETVFVEESTVAFEKVDGGPYVGNFETTFVATVGETYKVYWDGTAYECTCISHNGMPVIGNLSIVGEGADSGEPFVMVVFNGRGAAIYTADASASHTISISGMVAPVVKIDAKYLPISFKPYGESYLTFSSPSSFTLSVYNNIKSWDGTLEYFASDETWTIWEGTSPLSAAANGGGYVLYLRGTGNTVITGNDTIYRWVLTGTDIKCIGNIENLLGYATVASGAHPTVSEYCYYGMFKDCTSLTQAPALPATTLAAYCYYGMFDGCTSLTQAPALPATILATNCYDYMFKDCTSLTQAPALPATTLADFCYYGMFQGCTSLTRAPELPTTTLSGYCYNYMFYGCTSLTQAPDLPATTLAIGCYSYMFTRCTSLTQAPALPATILAVRCYNGMFSDCTSLTQAPALPATTLAAYCYDYMFQGCTSLKLSSTKTNEYTQAYSIPFSGNGTGASNALEDMFTSTGGAFTGTPSINTTYYLSSDNMIVRETEIATLNGYVDSMIDAAIGGVTTLHINVTAVNQETMEATFTADKTPMEMLQASANGPTWCVVTFAAGIMKEGAVSCGVPPAWYGGNPAFGEGTAAVHGDDGSNKFVYAVRQGLPDTWILDLSAFGG